MNEELNHLIQALREELQQYGEMLVRLDRHHQLAALQPGKIACAFSGEVQLQGAAIQHARRRREQACQEMAGALDVPAVVPVEEIVPLLPADYRPLVNELARETRHLMEQVAESLQRKRLCSHI